MGTFRNFTFLDACWISWRRPELRWGLELDEDDDCCDGDEGVFTERGRGGGDEGGLEVTEGGSGGVERGFKERGRGGGDEGLLTERGSGGGDDGLLEGFWGWLTGDAIVCGWAIDCSACCE